LSEPRNILVVLPSWVGDCVMATPTLRALRRLYPDARITGLAPRNCKPLFSGMSWLNRLLSFRRKPSLMRLAARLKRSGFDTAILLPNSFKSALLAKTAGIPRRIGYDRDGRGFLLTDKLLPPRARGHFVPVPTLRYYLGIASYLAGDVSLTTDRRMELFLTDADRRGAASVLEAAGVLDDSRRPWVLLNPGAQYGAAKIWPPEYFAAVADRMADMQNATVMISAAPTEREIVAEIRRHAQRPFIDLSAHGLTLGALKAICGQIDLMITNDTGPRHIAAAMGARVVTLFGPTDPQWTTIDYPREVELFEKVFCGPCQRKTCPLDHRCMTLLRPERVYDEAVELLRRQTALPVVA
jgi:heptosyltransferase-2